MIVVRFINKVFKLFWYSYLSAHVITAFISVIVYILATVKNTTMNESEFLSILNTSGILSAFFILALDKVDFEKILNRYRKNVTVGLPTKAHTVEITEGNKLMNTMFSFFIVTMLLICVQYICYLFDIISRFLLIYSIMYMTIGFIIVIGVWQGIALYDNKS